MKTIIISDILDGEKKSIIPYGLNIGKHTQTEVDILHIIDPRVYQGVYSSYADSQSLSPGEKLSHEEILHREKNKAYDALDRLLSKEASRLNYPLKINQILKISSLEGELKNLLGNSPDTLLVTSIDTTNKININLNELFSILKGLDVQIIAISPGQKFYELKKIVLLTDFSEDSIVRMHNMVEFIKPFRPQITACNVTNKDQLPGEELKSKAWKQEVSQSMPSSIIIKTNVLIGEDYVDTFSNYLRDNEHDLIMLPKEINLFYRKKIRPDNIASLIESFNKPVLFY